MLKKLYFMIAIISVFLILLLSSVFSYLYNLNYYDKKYQQNSVYDRFDKETAMNATKNLFGFFKSKNELDVNFYNERERSHLLDVKLLIQKQFVTNLN